jgi:hypothetical protein
MVQEQVVSGIGAWRWRTVGWVRLGASLLLAMVAFLPNVSMAQATRTWVSGVGDDANPCSRTAPCKTFAGAISKTAAGGEISVLDPGGFGAVTITKSITLDGGGGQVASILSAGTNGIIINAAATDKVVLRNLRINGADTGLNGIRFMAGASLLVQNVHIERFTGSGIDVQVANPAPNTAPAQVEVVDSSVSHSDYGLRVRSQSGVQAPTVATAERTRFLFNTTTGVSAEGATATVQLGQSSVFANGTGLSSVDSGALLSFGTNQVQGNSTNGAFTGTVSNQ